MTTINPIFRTSIETACREVGAKDFPTCVTTIEQKLERQADQICYKAANLVACKEQLFSQLWLRPEELKSKLAFIQKESQTYKAEEAVPNEAQCMTPQEWKIFQRVNADRARLADEYQKNGHSEKRAQPLKVDCYLVWVAREHSEDKAKHKPNWNQKNGDDPHINSEGRDAHQRIRSGTRRVYNKTAENVARGGQITNYANLTTFQDDFLLSPKNPPGKLGTHRANILNPDLSHLGVGIYLSPKDGQLFITQAFGGDPEFSNDDTPR